MSPPPEPERRGSVMTEEEELAAENLALRKGRKGGSILMGCAAQVGDDEETQRMLLEAEAVRSLHPLPLRRAAVH